MKSFALVRNPFALSVGVAAILLAGCSGSQALTGAPSAATGFGHNSLSHDRTFHYTGKAQSFAVPKGVTQITVAASGASGPIVQGSSCNRFGGRGGVVHATIRVTPSETLSVFVGGKGALGWGCGSQAGSGDGGFNGGADGGLSAYTSGGYYDEYYGDGGGGASDVRRGGSALSDRVVVAGGGGGGGGASYSQTNGGGGAGGGNTAGRGGGQGAPDTCQGWGAHGGTQSRGGKGGRGGDPPRSHGARGDFGLGGVGGSENPRSGGGGAGGGGGGGYYGGGGGGSGAHCGGTSGDGSTGPGGGGGGGSSYVEPGATHVTNQKGAALPGNGKVVISW
jgi:hypothetical protein